MIKYKTSEEVKQLAIKLHEGQLREDGEPYSNHVIRVGDSAADMITQYKGVKELVRQAGYLHDVLEDCSISIEDLYKELIDPKVLEICNLLNENNYSNYTECILTIVQSKSWAIYVKKADLLDNLKGQKSKNRKDKYELALAILDKITI